jgi:exopolysaccharide production protein ExoQ
MSVGFGGSSKANNSGSPRAGGVAAAPLAGVSQHFFSSVADDTYPNKYLRVGRQQRPARNVARGQTATMSLSLLFPILILLMISITLQQDTSVGSFDPQMGLRVAGYSLAALSVLFALGMRRFSLGPWIAAWALVPIFITATAIYAPDPYFTLTAGLAHLALLLFAWRMVSRHGELRTILVVVTAGTIIGALSVFAFYALPDLGRSTVDSLMGDPGGRMRGVTAQPNTLGTISALTLLLAVIYFRKFTKRQRVLVIAAIAIAGFCIAYSDSRTSMLALLLCWVMWWLCRANAALNLFTIVGIALVACLCIAFVPDVASLLSREGARHDDLSTFNGRWEIWTVAWEYIRSSPLLGLGYGSSKWFLPSDDRLFAAAVTAHNVYLELLFSGGAVLLALYAFGTSICIVRSATQRRVEALIVLMFFLIVGVAEATPFSGLPLFAAAVFYTAVALCLARLTGRQVPNRHLQVPVDGNRPSIVAPRRVALGRQR